MKRCEYHQNCRTLADLEEEVNERRMNPATFLTFQRITCCKEGIQKRCRTKILYNRGQIQENPDYKPIIREVLVV